MSSYAGVKRCFYERPWLASERIAEVGALWLDARFPNWADHIDASRLDMKDYANCIGGQLGVRWQFLRSEFARDTGFWECGLFVDKTEAWREQVLARQQLHGMNLEEEQQYIEAPAPVDIPTERPAEEPARTPDRQTEDVPELIPA